jgi:hypothetical protein
VLAHHQLAAHAVLRPVHELRVEIVEVGVHLDFHLALEKDVVPSKTTRLFLPTDGPS